MAHDAARPTTALNGTAMAATSRVRRIAASVSGSAKLSRKTSQPLRKRLDEHDDERKEQDRGEEQHRDADQHGLGERLRCGALGVMGQRQDPVRHCHISCGSSPGWR